MFDGKNAVEVLSHHLHTEPVPPSERAELDTSAELEALALECLAKEPENRPADASALAERVAACATPNDARAWFPVVIHRRFE